MDFYTSMVKKRSMLELPFSITHGAIINTKTRLITYLNVFKE